VKGVKVDVVVVPQPVAMAASVPEPNTIAVEGLEYCWPLGTKTPPENVHCTNWAFPLGLNLIW